MQMPLYASWSFSVVEDSISDCRGGSVIAAASLVYEFTITSSPHLGRSSMTRWKFLWIPEGWHSHCPFELWISVSSEPLGSFALHISWKFLSLCSYQLKLGPPLWSCPTITHTRHVFIIDFTERVGTIALFYIMVKPNNLKLHKYNSFFLQLLVRIPPLPPFSPDLSLCLFDCHLFPLILYYLRKEK